MNEVLGVKTLYFVRHGETYWNAIGRMQGQWEADLNEKGLAQAHGHGQLLSRLGVDKVYASPLRRADMTAQIICKALGADYETDDRLKEWDCGDWSGELRVDVKRKWPDEWAAFDADRYNYRGPNCENYPDMIARARPFLDEMLAKDHARVAIVSHGMIARAMLSTLLELTRDAVIQTRQPNDVVIRLKGEPGDFTAEHFVGELGPKPGIGEEFSAQNI